MIEPLRTWEPATSPRIQASSPETEPPRLSLLASDPLAELWMLSKRFAEHAHQLRTLHGTVISQSSSSAPEIPGCFSSTFDV